MKIQLLSSDMNSWIVPYGEQLKKILLSQGHNCEYIFSENQVQKGDVLVFLCYDKIYKSLNLNRHNLVVHESDLPLGRGMSPLTWQILDGKTKIPVTLLEASEGIDEGDIYDQVILEFDGTELNQELKHKQGLTTINLVLDFIDKYPSNISRKQIGNATYYKRRSKNDSELDINKTILDQFNLLRVCDNERYPAFFYHKGKKYVIKIFEDK